MGDEEDVPWDFEARHGTRFATDPDRHKVAINSPYHRIPVSDLAEFMAEQAPDAMARKIGIDGVYQKDSVHDVDLPSIRATALLRALILELKERSDEDFQQAAEELLDWRPEIPAGIDEDEVHPDTPFFSEAYLYNLLGKHDARTLLAMMRPIWEAAGIPRSEQP